MRRARKTSGRFLAWVFGFGVAYYFDTENGVARRKMLRQRLGLTARRMDRVLDAEAGDPPPYFYPELRGVPERHRSGDAVGMAAR